MIDVSILPIFFTAVFFLAISPGPDLVLISTYSSTKGAKAGLVVSIGVFLAGILQTILVALGLGSLMQSMPMLAYVVKIVGALYLSYLGIQMIRHWRRHQTETGNAQQPVDTSFTRLMSKGCLNNLLNPKALLFFSLFLPQFTHGSGELTTQILLLGLLLSTFVLIINCFLAVIFSQFGKLIGSKLKLGRHIDGFLGVIFLGLAARLATSK